MRRLFILVLSSLALISGKAFAQLSTKDYIPKKVLDSLYKLYPKAENVKWLQEPGYYIISFYMDSGTIYETLDLDNEGKLFGVNGQKETIRIPEPVMASFKRITNGRIYPKYEWMVNKSGGGTIEYSCFANYNFVTHLVPPGLGKINDKYTRPGIELISACYDSLPNVVLNSNKDGFIIKKGMRYIHKISDSLALCLLRFSPDGKITNAFISIKDSLGLFEFGIDSAYKVKTFHVDICHPPVFDFDSNFNYIKSNPESGFDIPVTDKAEIPLKIKRYINKKYSKFPFYLYVTIEHDEIKDICVLFTKGNKVADAYFDNTGKLLERRRFMRVRHDTEHR